MPFTQELPEWSAVGSKPPQSKLDTGWQIGERPPSGWWNWMLNRTYLSIQELQQEAINVDQKGVSNGVASLNASGKVPSSQLDISAPSDASTTTKGIVMLEDSVTSTSITKAATPKSVKQAYDLADAAVPTSQKGAPSGVATLGADGKVPSSQLNISAPVDATTSQKGVVQLSNATDSTSETLAATPKSVKDAKDGLSTQIGILSDNTVPYGTASGADSKTITITNAFTTLKAGLALSFKNTTANTTAVTLNVNGLGAKPVVKSGGTALSSGNLKAGGVYTVRYDGTSFILQGEGGSGNAVASDLLSGKTASTDAGDIMGTLVLPSKVKSMQSGSLSVYASSYDSTSRLNYETFSINAVDASKSVVEIQIIDTNGAPKDKTVSGLLDSNTTVRLMRANNATSYATINWKVLEYENIKSIQKGRKISNSSSINDVTISTVNLNKCLLYVSVASYNISNVGSDWRLSYNLTSNTNLRIQVDGTGYDKVIEWTVVELL